MTERPRYRALTALQRDNRRCRACAQAGYPLESLPVFEGHAGQRAYLYGQAPGVVEGSELRPWRGDAGKKLRAWLGMDEDTFYSTFYCASVTRCYPGRDSLRGDRQPSGPERALCAFWRENELRLLRPQLVVTVGLPAATALLGVKRLANAVGRRFDLNGAPVIPLAHSSGASAWLNDPANDALNRTALQLVLLELEKL